MIKYNEYKEDLDFQINDDIMWLEQIESVYKTKLIYYKNLLNNKETISQDIEKINAIIELIEKQIEETQSSKLKLQKIKFNSSSENTEKNINITYFGELYKNNSQNVKIVYGFGEGWRNTTTQEMQKIDNGFEVQINTSETDQLNYCFCNENNVWDNNFQKDYYFREDSENVYKDICSISVTKLFDISYEIEKYNQEYQSLQKNFLQFEVYEEEEKNRKLEQIIERKVEAFVERDNAKKIKDNGVLLISEVQNKVVLPYTAEEVEAILNNGENSFKNAQDVIDNVFTRKFTEYNNQIASRFKESVELITKREKMSKLDGINLGMELCKKRYLHPAIITACKNLDELNVYLDCLDKGELDDFKIFDIKYELYPVKAGKFNTVINKLSNFKNHLGHLVSDLKKTF